VCLAGGGGHEAPSGEGGDAGEAALAWGLAWGLARSESPGTEDCGTAEDAMEDGGTKGPIGSSW